MMYDFDKRPTFDVYDITYLNLIVNIIIIVYFSIEYIIFVTYCTSNTHSRNYKYNQQYIFLHKKTELKIYKYMITKLTMGI